MQPSTWDQFMAVDGNWDSVFARVRQFAFVFGVTVLSVIITVSMGFRSLWNYGWFFGVPVVTAIVFNSGFHQRFRMAIWLCALAFFTIMITGYFISI
jgi:hypothetical protein